MKYIVWNFPRLEKVIFNNNLAQHFSSCDYPVSRTDAGTLPHPKQVFWDNSERFLVFLLTTIAKRSFVDAAGFLDPVLDCDEFLL